VVVAPPSQPSSLLQAAVEVLEALANGTAAEDFDPATLTVVEVRRWVGMVLFLGKS
jgi:hypothetical protein